MDVGICGVKSADGIAISNCGGEQCRPGYTYGPAIRDHFLIHFVASGKGVLRTAEGEYSICAGQGFIIFPDEITVYSADDEQPWAYDWVGYRGGGAEEITKAAGLSRDRRVFTPEQPEMIGRLLRDISEDMSTAGELAAAGALIRFMAHLAAGGRAAQETRVSRRHYDRARWFMDGNYAKPITVQDVADFTGLSRSQLFRVFVSCEGKTPKEVLTALRLRHACRLLTDTDMSADEIARQAGLTSAQRLGALFREKLGVSPGAYRKGAVGRKSGQ